MPDSVGVPADALLDTVKKALRGLRLTPGCDARREAAILIDREAPQWLSALVAEVERLGARVAQAEQERDTLVSHNVLLKEACARWMERAQGAEKSRLETRSALGDFW